MSEVDFVRRKEEDISLIRKAYTIIKDMSVNYMTISEFDTAIDLLSDLRYKVMAETFVEEQDNE